MWRGLLVFLSRWFQIESLYKFNAKFRPRWEPRFVVYRNTRDLPRIGFAAMQAEGFVNLALPRLCAAAAEPRPCAHARRSAACRVGRAPRARRRRGPGGVALRTTRRPGRPVGRRDPAALAPGHPAQVSPYAWA